MNIFKVFVFAIVILSFSGCADSGQSAEEKKQLRENENKVRLEQSKKALNDFATKFSALPIEPFGYRSSFAGKYTVYLQEKYEGKVVVFRGTLLDVVKNQDGKYIAVFGSYYLTPTTITLAVTSKLLKKIIKTNGGKAKFLVAARINKIVPTYLEARVCEEQDCNNVSIRVNSFGKSFQMYGALVDIEQ